MVHTPSLVFDRRLWYLQLSIRTLTFFEYAGTRQSSSPGASADSDRLSINTHSDTSDNYSTVQGQYSEFTARHRRYESLPCNSASWPQTTLTGRTDQCHGVSRTFMRFILPRVAELVRMRISLCNFCAGAVLLPPVTEVHFQLSKGRTPYSIHASTCTHIHTCTHHCKLPSTIKNTM